MAVFHYKTINVPASPLTAISIAIPSTFITSPSNLTVPAKLASENITDDIKKSLKVYPEADFQTSNDFDILTDSRN